MLHDKEGWLNIFRNKADSVLAMTKEQIADFHNQASEINKCIKTFYEEQIVSVKSIAKQESWNKDILLNEILLITYVSYIVMLETRNKVWSYEYMAFARRIGELWEPFCKLTFEYSLLPLIEIIPSKFEAIQEKFQQDTLSYINSLSIDDNIKKTLKFYYDIPWNLVDSGGIKLDLDLHFNQNGVNYNCDFKSGFSSNEKGNTNRLLLVASIYHFLSSQEKTILFVRQEEGENNHYLQTLKKSNYWEVYCADDCYDAMRKYTGFDLRRWINNNIDWENDISYELRKHLQDNNLIKYLTW